MKTIFQVYAAYDCRGFRQRHYPSYPICWGEIMIATSLDAAERFIKIQSFDKDVLMYSVKENKINVGHYDSQCLTERIYDRKGILIDSRMFSTFGEGKNSRFYGRKPSEIRFSKGEFVEVVGYHEAYLGMVVGFPITEEEVQEINKKAFADGVEELQFDRFNDSYNVLSYDKECSGLGHVNSLRMIKPRFKVSEYQKDYFKGLYYEFEHYINGDELEEVVLYFDNMDDIQWINGVKPEIIEDSVRNYGHRTWTNAEWSDITFAFAADFKSPGEITTKKAAGDKFIGYQLIPAEVLREHDDCYWQAQGRKYAVKIRSNQNYRGEGIKLNIAGNSMISLSRCSLDADSVQDVIYQVLKNLLSEGIVISEVRSGGQSGADEFGIIAAQRLGLKCSILAPKGYRFHYKEGEEIEGYARFVKRFQE